MFARQSATTGSGSYVDRLTPCRLRGGVSILERGPASRPSPSPTAAFRTPAATFAGVDLAATADTTALAGSLLRRPAGNHEAAGVRCDSEHYARSSAAAASKT